MTWNGGPERPLLLPSSIKKQPPEQSLIISSFFPDPRVTFPVQIRFVARPVTVSRVLVLMDKVFLVPAPINQSDSYGRRKFAATETAWSHRRRRSSRQVSSPHPRRARQAPGSGGMTGGIAPVIMAAAGTITGGTSSSPPGRPGRKKPAETPGKDGDADDEEETEQDRASSSGRHHHRGGRPPQEDHRGMGQRPVLRVGIPDTRTLLPPAGDPPPSNTPFSRSGIQTFLTLHYAGYVKWRRHSVT